jgi:predicted DNA-binding transcriptional regulator AlpA
MTHDNLPAAKTASTITWTDKPLLSLRAASDLLSVSRSGLYRLQASGKLTFGKVGGRTVIRTRSLIEFVETIEDLPPAAPSSGVKGVQC